MTKASAVRVAIVAAKLAAGAALGLSLFEAGRIVEAEARWRDAIANGHAEPAVAADGALVPTWLPPCVRHWSLVRARSTVEAAGCVVGMPAPGASEAEPGTRRAWVGGRPVVLREPR